jgi:hypothetical protein
MAESATILIPDISGYTEFLTKTELVHSSHIINELLEAILAANSGEFVLSEVEGDALLLYHKGKPIEADALVRQCLSMFESFHTQLKIIERDSLCHCGACKTASNLTLKFIAHHGVVQEIKVMQFTKCSGLDMVVAHRLMKNRIASDEYILATPSCFDFSSLKQSPGALAWARSNDEYPAIGTIEYQYAPLAGVRSTIADPAPRISPVVELGDDSVAVEIDAPMLGVYQLVIDLDQRPRWLSAVERLDRPATTERIGMRHTCIFHGLTVEWVAVKSDIGDDEITYVEEGRIVEKDLPARASFILKRLGERKTSLQFHAKWLSSPGPPREMTNAVLADYKQGLETIKMLCEKPSALRPRPATAAAGAPARRRGGWPSAWPSPSRRGGGSRSRSGPGCWVGHAHEDAGRALEGVGERLHEAEVPPAPTMAVSLPKPALRAPRAASNAGPSGSVVHHGAVPVIFAVTFTP